MDLELFDERRIATTARTATFVVELSTLASSVSPMVESLVFIDQPFEAVMDWTRRRLHSMTDAEASVSLVANWTAAPATDLHALLLSRLRTG